MPSSFSDVFVRGTQVMVRRRQADGSLSPAQPYLIKGVDWSPATRAPLEGFDPRSGGRAPYGFFFDGDWRAPGLPGHDLLRYWQQSQITTRHLADLALIAQLHANTVRVYTDLGTTPAEGLRVLDECYRQGIMVILTVASAKDDVDSGRYLALVKKYKSHPALLMWALGNEWNLNRYYGYSTLDQAITATQQMAEAITREDPNHPVSSVLGDQPNDFRSITQRVSAVGVWALNIYRGSSFGNLFTQWTGVTFKPFYLSEFGTDSFKTQRYTVYNGNQAINVIGTVDEATQQTFDLALWKELVPRLSALDAKQPCLGGFVFEFNDELWKVGSFHVGLGRPASYYDGRDLQAGTIDDNTSYANYDAEGFIQPGQHPDGVGNEEYFGLVDADRHPKAAYTALQQFYNGLVATQQLPGGARELARSRDGAASVTLETSGPARVLWFFDGPRTFAYPLPTYTSPKVLPQYTPDGQWITALIIDQPSGASPSAAFPQAFILFQRSGAVVPLYDAQGRRWERFDRDPEGRPIVIDYAFFWGDRVELAYRMQHIDPVTNQSTLSPQQKITLTWQPTVARAPALLTPPPQELRDRLGLSSVYQKYADAAGLLVVGSSQVSDVALREAAYLMNEMLASRPDIRTALIAKKIRVAVMAVNELTTFVPEHSVLIPSVYWDRRARGLGATDGLPVTTAGEENLLGYPGDPYAGYSILIHEFAHTILNIALDALDPTFRRRLRTAYDRAIKAGLWKDTYAGTSEDEYWAEGAQSWFNANVENDAWHNDVNTREELNAYDPGLATLLAEVFGDGPWRYQSVAARLNQEHLQGYDPAYLPTFAWPNHLIERARNDPSIRELPLLQPSTQPFVSKPSGVDTFLFFANLSPAPVQLYSVDTQGKTTFSAWVDPQGTYIEDTYAGDGWVVVDKDGISLGVVVAGNDPGKVFITAAALPQRKSITTPRTRRQPIAPLQPPHPRSFYRSAANPRTATATPQADSPAEVLVAQAQQPVVTAAQAPTPAVKPTPDPQTSPSQPSRTEMIRRDALQQRAEILKQRLLAIQDQVKRDQSRLDQLPEQTPAVIRNAAQNALLNLDGAKATIQTLRNELMHVLFMLNNPAITETDIAVSSVLGLVREPNRKFAFYDLSVASDGQAIWVSRQTMNILTGRYQLLPNAQADPSDRLLYLTVPYPAGGSESIQFLKEETPARLWEQWQQQLKSSK